MMQEYKCSLNLKINAFKNDLRNLRYIEATIKNILFDIECIEYEMAGVKGVSFEEKAHGYIDEAIKLERLLSLGDDLERANKDLLHFQSRKEKLIVVLNRMDEQMKGVAIGVYADGNTFNKYAIKLGYSVKGLQRRLDREIKKNL